MDTAVTEPVNVEKELEEKGYVPYGVSSFAELRQAREAQEKAALLSNTADDLIGLTWEIIHNPDITDKAAAIIKLSNEFAEEISNTKEKEKQLDEHILSGRDETVLRYVVNKVKSVLGFDNKGDKQGKEGLMIWKSTDTDQYMWLARYSNNFRDDDNPPEIISEKSHKRFVEMVDNKEAPMPELWLWHVPEWKLGQATEVAYDDSGFAIAVGYFDKGAEPVAEWLSKQKDLLVSHGMPPWSIKRDKEDKSVIIEHQTREISPLPGWAAANKITGFVVLDNAHNENKGEAEMSIPDKKKKSLIQEWKIDPSLLDRLEQQNATDAQKATEEGREYKEISEETEEVLEEKAEDTPVAEAETTETTEVEETTQEEKQEQPVEEQPEENQMSEYPTRTEVAEAFGTILGELQVQMSELTEEVGKLAKELNTLKETDEDKIATAASNVPAASLAEMLAKSVIGRRETAVDGRTTLGKDKPKEAKSTEDPRVGIPFIDRMLAGASGDEE